MQGAGRTDAGVHALGQVAHVDLAKELGHRHRARRAQRASAPASDRDSRRRASAADDFNARFSAIKRHYLYRIVNRRADLDARSRPRLAGAAPARCRSHACRRAAAGRQARFHHLPLHRMPGQIAGEDARSARCCARRRRSSTCIASARSFLHNQVRSMVGSLVLVGEGKWSADDLAARSPRATAPPAARWRRRTGFIWCGWITRRNSGRESSGRSSSARAGRRSARARRWHAWSVRPGRIPPPGNNA